MSVPSVSQLGGSILFGSLSEPEKSFVTSKGKVVKLRLKESQDDISVTWRHDETYGIDINKLLDKVENSESKAAAPKLPETKRRYAVFYGPRSGGLRPFFDLVGNERTNRRVLKWLRQWSPLVFGETLPKAPSSSWQTMKNDVSSPDPLLRPNKKILLINGPPGIGKTSVAHLVAKQAGYSVIEINASDERAGTRVRDKVHNALFNHTFDNRPVCLIADEIDGSVENGFIKVLVDVVNSDYKATQRLISQGSVKSKRKNQKKSSKLLTRPIITVCNNIYVGALDKLKPHCEIITFTKPSEKALQDRLEQVCRKEMLNLEKKVLKEVAELAQGDIRNCLNNLQFLATKELPANQSPSYDEQSKDTSLSWYRMCNKLFKKDPHKETKVQFRNLLKDVEVSSSYEKIVHGCFTLFPEVKYSDNGVNKPSVLADWLYFNDLMFNSLFEHNGDLLRYNAAVPMAFFQLFSDIANKEDLRIKANDFELRESQKNIIDLLKTVLGRIPISSKVYMDRESLILEILPFLDYIIAPDFAKIKNVHQRQNVLNNVVTAVEGLGLTFGETNEVEMANVICIEPPFHKISILDERRLKDVVTKRPALLNLILAKVQESKVKKRAISRVAKEHEEVGERNKRQKPNTSTPIDFFKSQYGSVQKGQITPAPKELIQRQGTTKPSEFGSNTMKVFRTLLEKM